MRNIVLILEGLLGSESEPSVLRERTGFVRRLPEVADIFRGVLPTDVETPEAAFLGMNPQEVRLAQGPLTVAAFGAEPPDRSTHFHVSVMSLVGGEIKDPDSERPSEALQKDLLTTFDSLKSKLLTVVPGRDWDHGLVWEKWGDHLLHGPSQVVGKALDSVLPEGDAERDLRRFIDDSINILNDSEENQRGIDDGLQPINLLWPWGAGIRQRVPKMALRYGSPVRVITDSLRLEGLARLAGLRVDGKPTIGSGLQTKWDTLRTRIRSESDSIVVLTGAKDLRRIGDFDALDYFAREVEKNLLEPLEEAWRTERSKGGLPGFVFIATGQEQPSKADSLYALVAEVGGTPQQSVPFDERVLSESRLRRSDVAQTVLSTFTGI